MNLVICCPRPKPHRAIVYSIWHTNIYILFCFLNIDFIKYSMEYKRHMVEMHSSKFRHFVHCILYDLQQ